MSCRWHNQHASKEWDDDVRPSAQDCVNHACSLRSTVELKAYMKRYSTKKVQWVWGIRTGAVFEGLPPY